MENNTNTNNGKKLQECGAFWKKTAKSGSVYLTGTVKSSTGSDIKVVVFSNQYKEEGSNQPDYRVYLDNSSNESSAPRPAAKVAKATAKPSQSEDIPF
jgi:uncharacterized protein (DUF736 family)